MQKIDLASLLAVKMRSCEVFARMENVTHTRFLGRRISENTRAAPADISQQVYRSENTTSFGIYDILRRMFFRTASGPVINEMQICGGGSILGEFYVS